MVFVTDRSKDFPIRLFVWEISRGWLFQRNSRRNGSLDGRRNEWQTDPASWTFCFVYNACDNQRAKQFQWREVFSGLGHFGGYLGLLLPKRGIGWKTCGGYKEKSKWSRGWNQSKYWWNLVGLRQFTLTYFRVYIRCSWFDTINLWKLGKYLRRFAPFLPC